MESRISSNDDADSPFEVQEHDGILRLTIPGKTNWKDVWIFSVVIIAAGYFGARAVVAMNEGDVASHPLDLLMAVCAVASFLYGLAKALFSSQTIEIGNSIMRIRNTVIGIGFSRSYELVAVSDLEFVPEHDGRVKSKPSPSLNFELTSGNFGFEWFFSSKKSQAEMKHYPSHLIFHYGTKPVRIAPGLRPDEMLKLLKVLAPYLAPAKLLYERAYESRAVSTLPS
jgi:hypothetical protein